MILSKIKAKINRHIFFGFPFIIVMLFSNCSSDSTDTSPVGSLNASALISGRIVYADYSSNKLVTISADGTTSSNLISASGAACPSISSDGNVLGFSLLDRKEIVVVNKDGTITRYSGIGNNVSPFRIALNTDGSKIICQDPDEEVFTNGCGPILSSMGGS